MGACRYGIFLREFNSIANEWDAELNSRKESSYLQVTMYYFVYHIDTISTYWREKSTLLTNENKGSTPRIKIVQGIGAKTQDEKMSWNTTKTNDGRNF